MALLLRNSCNFTFQSLKNVSLFGAVSSLSNKKRYSSNNAVDVKSATEDTLENELINLEKEKIIEAKRNVSRLNPEHRNMVHDKVPFPEPKADYHLRVKYKRKIYGTYGSASGINPGIMWPTKQEIKERKEYEAVAYPLTIQEMVRDEISKREAEEMEIMERQKKIKENMTKLNQWMKDLANRRSKRIEIALAAKAKKDKLIEEVRRHFGYSVDYRDERFQAMLEQKAKEERQAAKLMKKKKYEEQLMQELLATQAPKGNPSK